MLGSTSMSLMLQQVIPLLLLLPAQQARAFMVTPFPVGASANPVAPHVSVRRPRSATVGGHCCAAVEDAVGSVALTAEVWDGFGEEDHDRFLAEFWQKKPLLIRQAVKG